MQYGKAASKNFSSVRKSHAGGALVPIPKRSRSARRTSTLQWGMVWKRLTPNGQLEADMAQLPVLLRYQTIETELADSRNNQNIQTS
jgi:hypothetical protein